MKRIRKLTRFTALLLILAVSLTLFPVSGTDTAAPAEPVSTEVLSLREENVKHFAVGNNTYQAVAYGHPVHKLDEDGNWVDIDNSLTLSGSSYATEDGRVSFTKSFAPNQNLMTLAEDGTSVSMALLAELGNQMTTQPMSLAVVSNPQNSILTAEDAMNAVFSSSVTYEGVLPDTDLEYTVDASSVKEYVVVNAPQSDYAYHFALTLSGLTAQMEEDGSVGLYTAEDERKYTIPAPYMFDAAGSFSHAVAYTLQGENGKYFLTVTADTAWLNASDRVWPVKIDPTIAVTSDAEDTYIDSQYATANYGSAEGLKVGSGKNAYFKMPDFSVPDGSRVILAYLRLYYYFGDGVTAGSDTLGVYQMLNPWNENTLTWNTFSASTKGSASTATATKTFYGSSGATAASPLVTDFDILDIVSAWQSGSNNYGVALKRISGSHSEMYFCSNEYGVMFRPRIVYQYQDIPVYVYKSYYDSSFQDKVPLIGTVIDTTNDVFMREFSVEFEMPSSAQYCGIFADDCPNFEDIPSNLSEKVSCYCELEDHTSMSYGHGHANVDYITSVLKHPVSNGLVSTGSDLNASAERAIMWSDRDNIQYYTRNTSDQGWTTTNANGAVYASSPVIVCMKLVPFTRQLLDNYTQNQFTEACMGFILMHETAHSFEMPEIYEIEQESLHESEWTHQYVGNCIMSTLVEDAMSFAEYYYEVKQGDRNAFCVDCKSIIRSNF